MTITTMWVPASHTSFSHDDNRLLIISSQAASSFNFEWAREEVCYYRWLSASMNGFQAVYTFSKWILINTRQQLIHNSTRSSRHLLSQSVLIDRFFCLWSLPLFSISNSRILTLTVFADQTVKPIQTFFSNAKPYWEKARTIEAQTLKLL